MTIKSTRGLHTDRLKILLHGFAGSGKTHQASTLEGKTLVISAEGGLLTLNDFDIDVLEVSNLEDVRNAYGWLLEPETAKKYDNIFVDSLTEIFDFAIKDIKDTGQKMTFGEWGELKEVMMRLTKAFRDLKDYNVIFTALPAMASEQGMKRIVPAFQGGFKDVVEGLFDFVFYLENKDGTRVLHTRDNGSIACKSRVSSIDKLIENPSLGSIIKSLKPTTTK